MVQNLSSYVPPHPILSPRGRGQSSQARRVRGAVVLFFLLLCSVYPAQAEDALKGGDIDAVAEEAAAADKGSGLPLPRFASLKSDNVYVRTGPSMDYPIKWIYKKEGLPVEIIQEFDSWRKIKDPNGEVGWAHKILLSGKRTAEITSVEAVAFGDKDMEKPSVKFEKGVFVQVEECEKLACRVQFAPYEGWIEKKYLWGVYGSDIFN